MKGPRALSASFRLTPDLPQKGTFDPQTAKAAAVRARAVAIHAATTSRSRVPKLGPGVEPAPRVDNKARLS